MILVSPCGLDWGAPPRKMRLQSRWCLLTCSEHGGKTAAIEMELPVGLNDVLKKRWRNDTTPWYLTHQRCLDSLCKFYCQFFIRQPLETRRRAFHGPQHTSPAREATPFHHGACPGIVCTSSLSIDPPEIIRLMDTLRCPAQPCRLTRNPPRRPPPTPRRRRSANRGSQEGPPEADQAEGQGDISNPRRHKKEEGPQAEKAERQARQRRRRQEEPNMAKSGAGAGAARVATASGSTETGRAPSAERTTSEARTHASVASTPAPTRSRRRRRRARSSTSPSARAAPRMDPVQHLWIGKSVYNGDISDATFDLYVPYVKSLDNKHKLQVLNRAKRRWLARRDWWRRSRTRGGVRRGSGREEVEEEAQAQEGQEGRQVRGWEVRAGGKINV